jgi:Na+-transporting methylmalonyl-CoA/oxaloacetate decarboxylase gamma subunit
MEDLQQGLMIAAVAITGVFVNLLILMVAVIGIGRLFGKKPAAKKAATKALKKPQRSKDAAAQEAPAASED